MRVRAGRLSGILLIEPAVVADHRGAFVETYQRDRYLTLGIPTKFVQDNHSRSVRGTIRGLHYQLPPGQAKLVRVARGAVLDVVVDLRRGSSTFGEWEAFGLDDRSHDQLYIPAGFAHGFCVTSDVADVLYKVSSYYSSATERGIAWNDPDLAIPWPTTVPVLSERDRRNPRLADIATELPDWS